MKREDLARRYLIKVESDPDLASWRSDSGFQDWFRAIKADLRTGPHPNRQNLKENQVNSRFANEKGLRAYMEKQYDRAIQEFQKALNLEPSYIAARINLAGILALKGQADDSLSNLKTAFRMNPRYTMRKVDEDPDFDNIRKRPEFKAWLKEIKEGK